MKKMTGAEFVAFWKDEEEWRDLIVEDETITINGVVFDYKTATTDPAEVVEPNDVVTITGGCVYTEAGYGNQEPQSFEVKFLRWKIRRESAFLLIQVELTKLETLLALLEAHNIKVLAGLPSEEAPKKSRSKKEA